MPLSLSNTGKTEIDANVFVDICDKLHRVIVVERNKLPDPQQPGCARRDISGLYWVRPVNTLVVDVAEGRPSLLLVKGSYNPECPRTWNTAPRGFVVYGGGTIPFLSRRHQRVVRQRDGLQRRQHARGLHGWRHGLGRCRIWAPMSRT